MNIDSIVLIIAMGIKMALLGFIFQDKLIQLISQKKAPYAKISTTKTHSKSNNLCGQPQTTIVEMDTTDLQEEQEEDPEKEEAEEESSAEVSISSKTKTQTFRRKKTHSIVKLAQHVFTLSLLGENAKATVPNALPRVQRILADVENSQSKIYFRSNFKIQSQSEDLSNKYEISKMGKIPLLDPINSQLEYTDSELPQIFELEYKSKRGSKMAAKYWKYRQEITQSIHKPRHSKKRMQAKIAKLGRKIARKRPFASNLCSVNE